jgi:hypothetical protein
MWLYKSIFPLVEKENVLVQQEKEFYQINFNIKNNYYLALINTSNEEKIYKLPNGLFFNNIEQEYFKGGKVITIPKHASKCLYRVNVAPFTLVGAKGHFFCGTEINNIFISNNMLEISWNDEVINPKTIFYRIPNNYEMVVSDNSVIKNRQQDGDFIILELEPQ